MKNMASENTADIPDHIYLPRGMLAPKEHFMLYRAARDQFTGAGEIVDAGAFVGASTFCLAAGLEDNSIVAESEKLKKIHSYDFFVANDQYVIEYLQNNFFYRMDRFGRPSHKFKTIDLNYDFLHVHKYQTAGFDRYIERIQADFLTVKWETNRPIEILFIDLAKSIALNRHVASEMFPALIPETSIVVQQDYNMLYSPFTHITMFLLRDYFKTIHSHVSGSRVFLLEKPIPADVLEKAAKLEISDQQADDAFKIMIDEEPDEHKPMLIGAHAWWKRLKGHPHEANQLAAQVVSQFGRPKTYWFQLLQQAFPEATK